MVFEQLISSLFLIHIKDTELHLSDAAILGRLGMGMSLTQVRIITREHLVEECEGGFRVSRRDLDGQRFSRLVSEILEASGEDFVALPVSDGKHGYEGVFIIPFE